MSEYFSLKEMGRLDAIPSDQRRTAREFLDLHDAWETEFCAERDEDEFTEPDHRCWHFEWGQQGSEYAFLIIGGGGESGVFGCWSPTLSLEVDFPNKPVPRSSEFAEFVQRFRVATK